MYIMLNNGCEWPQALDIRSTTPNAAIATTGRCATPMSAKSWALASA
jgi:hypothetical protein